MKRWIRKFAATMSAIGLVFSMALISAANASAATCYGDYCSNKDPQSTGCSSDARTVSYTDVYHSRSYVGFLELRWSPSCKTNWARFTPQSGLNYKVRAVQPETGYAVDWRQYSPWQTGWSNQIYSPTKCVYAEVVAWDFWKSFSTKTACI